MAKACRPSFFPDSVSLFSCSSPQAASFFRLHGSLPIGTSMITEYGNAPVRAAERLRVRLDVRFALAGLIVFAGLTRILASVVHATATYFPDEYIYAALGRSLGTQGMPVIRGSNAHFPALLEPLVAAPAWALASTGTAYHLVQAENAIFMSLAAIPVYLMARRLGLSGGYSLFCAAFALTIPDLAFAGSILSDPLAYPLVLAALCCGFSALERPTRRSQLGFFAFAILATFTRVQYVVLVPAFIVGALLLDRRAAFRTQRLPFVIVGAGFAVLLALGPARILGYYSAVEHLHVGWGLLRWAGLDLVLLSLAGGIVLVPGAIVALTRTRDRRDRALAALVVPFATAVMLEAAIYASNGSDQFKERYLFVLLPLLPVAFGVYLRQGRPAPWVVSGVAAAIAVATASLSLTSYASGFGYGDSPLLWAFVELERLIGVPVASLTVTLCAALAAGLAVAVAFNRFRMVALGAVLVFAGALSLGATVYDTDYASAARETIVAGDPSWVDRASNGPVTAIETAGAPTAALDEQLFWNKSINRELLVGAAQPTDTLGYGALQVTKDGLLEDRGRRLDSEFLLQGFEVTVRLTGATSVARDSSFTLWRPDSAPRLTTYELGRYWDGWLAPEGGLEVWSAVPRAGTASFTLSLPGSYAKPVTIRFGDRSYRVSPGQHRRVSIPVTAARPWTIRFGATAGAALLPDHRPVSVRSTTPIFTPA